MTLPDIYVPAGSSGHGNFTVDIDPQRAGWAFSGLRVLVLEAGASQLVDLPVDLDGRAPGEGQDEELGLAGLDDLGGAGLENEDAQARECPTSTLGVNVDGEIAMAGGAGGNVDIGKSHLSLLGWGFGAARGLFDTRLGRGSVGYGRTPVSTKVLSCSWVGIAVEHSMHAHT